MVLIFVSAFYKNKKVSNVSTQYTYFLVKHPAFGYDILLHSRDIFKLNEYSFSYQPSTIYANTYVYTKHAIAMHFMMKINKIGIIQRLQSNYVTYFNRSAGCVYVYIATKCIYTEKKNYFNRAQHNRNTFLKKKFASNRLHYYAVSQSYTIELDFPFDYQQK